MNELQRFTSELTLSNGATREKNLYKLQNMLSPQIFSNKNKDEIKIELQRNILLFSNTSDEDFLALMKIAARAYIDDVENAKKPIFNSEYVLKFKRLLRWLKDEGISDLYEMSDMIYDYLNGHEWVIDKKYHADRIFSGIINHFCEPVKKDAYMAEEWSFKFCCKAFDFFDMSRDNAELYFNREKL